MISLLDLENRTHTGPYIKSRDFGMKIYSRAKELVTEYEITRDPKDIIPTDVGLADDVFKASMDLIEDVGFYCIDTSRVVKLERKEIVEGLRDAPSEASFGAGGEFLRIKSRELGEKRPIQKWLGPWGAQISSPGIFLLIHQSYAQERIDALQDGVIAKLGGKMVRGNEASEIMSAAIGARMLREAVRRAGRRDMPISFDCVGGSTSAFPAIFIPEGIRPTDYATIFDITPEMSFSFIDVNKVVMAKQYCVHRPALGVVWNPYGGLGGGSETLAIVSTADAIFPLILEGVWGVATGGGMSVTGVPKYEDIPWFQIVNKLALKRNTHALVGGGPWVYSEPCTEMVVHELAYLTIPITISSDFLITACAAQGSPFDLVTGMEARITSEVADAMLGKSLKDANEWAKNICEKHLKGRKPQKGKTFQECYDPKTVMPSKEYVEIYEKKKKEYKDMGMKFV